MDTITGVFNPSFALPFGFSPWPPDTSRPEFPRYPQCPPLLGCVGHADPESLDTHFTHWERFGPSGVVVEVRDGRPVEVRTENAPTLWTPAHALLYAAELTSAARFAQQYAWAAVTGADGTQGLAKD